MTHLAPSNVQVPARHFQAQWLGVILLSSCAWLGGVVPSFSAQSLLPSWSSAAMAQSYKVREYAGAVLEIEPLRQDSFREVRNIMGGKVPSDICRQSSMPNSVSMICDRFLDRSAAIIQRHNLTVNEFNEMTQRSKSDPQLMKAIQAELIRLQRR